MSQNTRHGLWAVVFDSDVLGGITMLRVNTGSQVRNEARSGEVYARHQSLVAQKPVATFATNALAAQSPVAPIGTGSHRCPVSARTTRSAVPSRASNRSDAG